MENDQESPVFPFTRLPSLPNELLAEVFGYVDSHELTTTPICRGLLTITQRCLWRSLRIPGAFDFEGLNKRVWAKSSYLKEVRAIQVGVQRLESSHSEADPFGAASVVVDFLDLLGQSPKLEELVLLGCMRLIDVVLDSSTALVRFLARIRRLRLGGHFSFDPYHPSFLLEANRFPQLYEFTCTNWDYNVAFHSSHPAPPIPRPSSLVSLSLDGDMGDGFSAVLLLKHCPNLRTLHIRHRGSTACTQDLVRALPQPARIIDLVLSVAGPFPYRDSVNLVPLFTSVTRLSLGGGIVPFESEFYDSLRALPLQYLIFISGAYPNLASLAALLLPPSPHPTLLKLTLDYATGVRGPSVIKPDGTLIFETSFGIELHPGWRIPYLGWNPEKLGPVTNRETCDFLISVRESPVEVDGSIFEALEVYADYEEEVAIMQRCRVALQQGRVMRSLEQLEAFEEEEANKAKEAAEGESGEDVEDEDQDDGEDEDEE